MRYALTRDNHLEPGITIDEIKEFLPQLAENKKYWCEKLISEIQFHFNWYDFEKVSKGNQEKIKEFEEFLQSQLKEL